MPVHMVADEEKWQEAKRTVTKLFDMSPLNGDSYWRLVMITYRKDGGRIMQHMHKSEEPLLLLSDKLFDIQKGRGNRDGLIQQVVTYVRDGHTVTRKQWVRSEFADHASKDEEEKKDTELHKEEREANKRKKDLKDDQVKHKHQDERERRKVQEAEDKGTHHGRVHKLTDKQMEEYKKKLAKKKKDAKKEDKDKKQTQDKDNKKEKKADAKHGAFGQGDQTRADNKREQEMVKPH